VFPADNTFAPIQCTAVYHRGAMQCSSTLHANLQEVSGLTSAERRLKHSLPALTLSLWHPPHTMMLEQLRQLSLAQLSGIWTVRTEQQPWSYWSRCHSLHLHWQRWAGLCLDSLCAQWCLFQCLCICICLCLCKCYCLRRWLCLCLCLSSKGLP